MADPTTDITDEEIDALLAEVTDEIDDSKEKNKLTTSEKTVTEVDINKQIKPQSSTISTSEDFNSVTTSTGFAVESELKTNEDIKKTEQQSEIEGKPAVVSLTAETAKGKFAVNKQESEFPVDILKQPVLDKGLIVSKLPKNGSLPPADGKVTPGDETVLKKKLSSTRNDGITINKRPGAAAAVSGEGLDKVATTEAIAIKQDDVDLVTSTSTAVGSTDAKTATTSKSVPIVSTTIPTSPNVVKPNVSSSEDMLAAADGIISDKKIQDRDTLKKKNAQMKTETKEKDELDLPCDSGKSSAAARSESSSEQLKKTKTSETVTESIASPMTSSWGWGSISSWGSTVLSSATSLTSQVGGSMYQVLEAVESSLVEPEVVISADQLRQMNRESRAKKTQETSEELLREESPRSVTTPVVSSIDRASSIDGNPVAGSATDGDSSSTITSVAAASTAETGWFTDWMGLRGLPGAVHKGGKRVVGSGLHVLGSIGRKTLSIWNTGADDDPIKENVPGSKSLLMKRFDDCLGLVHFDALKTLSSMSREKLTMQLDMVSSDSFPALNADLALISDAFDLGEMGWELQLSEVDQDFQRLIDDYVSRLTLSIKADKLVTLHESIVNWLASCRTEDKDGRNCPPEDVHEMAVQMLAELTANCIALFHKIAQLILVDTCTPALAYKLRALCLAGLTKVVCTEVWIQMRHFTEHINKSQKGESNGGDALALIQSLTVDASNCSTCLQDAFRLILPIMHLALTRVHPLCLENTGIPHLEGLQIISRMSALSVRGARSAQKKNADEMVQRQIRDIAAQFDLSHLLTPEGHDENAVQAQDFRASIAVSLGQLGVEKSTEQIVATQARIRQWLSEQTQKRDVPTSPSDIHQKAIQSLTEFKSVVIEIYHNVAESLLSDQARGGEAAAETVDYFRKVEALTSVTRVFCREVGAQSTHFTSCLTAFKAEENLTVERRNEMSTTVTPFITNIYLEASNCMTCIQDGYQLLLPILQLAVIKQHERPPTEAKVTK